MVALVRGVHGLNGAIRVEVLTDHPERRFVSGAVLHREGDARPLTISSAEAVVDGVLPAERRLQSQADALEALGVLADRGERLARVMSPCQRAAVAEGDLREVVERLRARIERVRALEGGPRRVEVARCPSVLADLHQQADALALHLHEVAVDEGGVAVAAGDRCDVRQPHEPRRLIGLIGQA